MPLYEYRCQKCLQTWEDLARVDEEKSCPSCSAPGTRLLPSTLSIRFRGSGFYTTDYSQKKSA